MDHLPLIVPITEPRLDAAGVLRRAVGLSSPSYVTQRGRFCAVLLARPVYERLRHEHEILCRVFRGELDVGLQPDVTLEQALSRGERALHDEHLAEARALAAEARRLDEREREVPSQRAAMTLEEFFAEVGWVPDWPGAPGHDE